MGLITSPTTVELALDRHDLQTGNAVNVRVLVGGQPDERVHGGRVELAYVNRFLDREGDYDPDGPDYTRTVTRSETIVAAWQPMASAAHGGVAFGEQAFTLTVPREAPPSAHEPTRFGDVVSWEVRAILDRRMYFDPDASEPVTVHSPAEQYASWARSPISTPVDCPMGLNLPTRLLRPGEVLSGTLSVSPRESFKGGSLRVQLERRRTDIPDNLKRTETTVGVQLAGETVFSAGQVLSFPFAVALEEGVPPTFYASRNNLHWFVQGVIDRNLRSDYVVEAEIVVYTGTPAGPAAAQPVTPAGWYADPWRHARVRYWDGQAWSAQTAD